MAASLSQHRADWGITIEPVAKYYDLQFIPVREEFYDFIIPADRRMKKSIVAFIHILNTAEYQDELKKNGFLIRNETGQWAE